MTKKFFANANKGVKKKVSVAAVTAVEPVTGLFRNRKERFGDFVRNKVADSLVQKGYDRQSANAMANSLDDDEIDRRRNKHRIGALGDGSFLQWLIDHKDQILELIMSIVKIFLMFGDEATEKAFTDFEANADNKVYTMTTSELASMGIDANA